MKPISIKWQEAGSGVLLSYMIGKTPMGYFRLVWEVLKYKEIRIDVIPMVDTPIEPDVAMRIYDSLDKAQQTCQEYFDKKILECMEEEDTDER